MELLINYCREEEHRTYAKPTKLCLFFKSSYFPVKKSGCEFAGQPQVFFLPGIFHVPAQRRSEAIILHDGFQRASGVVSRQLSFITTNNIGFCWPYYLFFLRE